MRQPFSPKPVALAIALSLAPIAFSPVFAADNAQIENTQVQRFNFSIAAGSLTTSLNQIAQTAQLTISYTPALTAGKSAAALQGSYTVEQALSKILTGTDLKVIEKVSGGYTLILADDSAAIGTLATAVVQGDGLSNGSNEDGYRVDEISGVGPWQGRTLQESPYSINVTSEDLIQNLQATNADQIFMMNPLTQLNRPSMMQGKATVFMRGFEQGKLARNGILPQGFVYSQGLVMEEVAQVEVLSGLSGFIYGASGVGGIINYVTKKPTDERLNALTFGNTSGSNIYLHGDFGGQFDDDGTFGYRVNLVTQDGETHIEHNNIKRNSVSVSLDWQITDNLIIEINGNKRDHQVLGEQPDWYMADDSVQRPDANSIDNSLLWNQPWVESNWDSERLGASVNWRLTDNISLRAAYLDEDVLEREVAYYGNEIQADGTIEQGIWSSLEAPTLSEGTAGYAFIDFGFNTGNIAHNVTAGWQFGDSSWSPVQDGYDAYSQDEYYTINLTKPEYFPKPKWDVHGGPTAKRYVFDNQSFTLGDDIKLTEQWSALIGISYTNITFADGAGDDYGNDYDESLVTPTVSLVYKPTDTITTYASYIEGVEQGGTADDIYQGEVVVNADAVLEPMVSTQIELGIKASVGDMLLTAAVFNIDRVLEQYQLDGSGQYKFTQDGRQVHKGLEFTATGKLTDNLTLVGGFTFLDATIKDLADKPELEGNTPQNVSEEMIKLYAEYDLDSLPGLVINGGFSYNGSFYGGRSWGDNRNTEKLPAYTVVNLGARYGLTVANKEVTLRLNVNNLTDERYWANYRYLGASRTVSLSANINF